MAVTGPYVAPLPTPTGAPSDDYANKINAAINELRDALEAGVTEGDLNLQTLLSAQGLPLIEAAYLGAVSSASAPVDPGSAVLYVKSGDWYAKDASGNEVRITQSGALAVTAAGTTYGDQQRALIIRNFTATTGTTGGSHNGYSIIEANSAPTVFLFGPLPLRVGERIKAARVRTNKNSTGVMTVQFATSTDGGGISTSGSSATSNTSGLQTIALTLASPVTTTQDNLYYLQVTCANVSDRLHAISYTVDKIV